MAEGDKDDTGGKPGNDGKAGDDSALKAALEKERTRAQEAENQLKALRVEMAKLKKDDDASKSEMEKLAERVAAAEGKAAEAEARQMRAEVAIEKKLSPGQAKRLAGATREELLSDADDLLAAFKPPGEGDKNGENGDGEGKGDDGSGSGDGDGEGRNLPPSGRPKEKLTSGAVPGTGSGEKSPAQLADEILKSDF